MNTIQIKKLIILCFILAGIFFGFIGLFTQFDNRIHDSFHTQKLTLKNVYVVGIDDKSLEMYGRWPWNRTLFAQFFDKLNTSIVGVDIAFVEPTQQDSQIQQSISRRDSQIILAKIPSTAELFDATYGTIDVITDADGITRSVLLTHESFAVVMYEKTFGILPEFPKARANIRYMGKPIQQVSFADIMQNASIIPDHSIIFLGVTTQSLKDDFIVPTSTGKSMNGVEIHATIFHNLVQKTFLQRMSSWQIALLVGFFACIGGCLTFIKRKWLELLILLVFFASYLMIIIFAFEKNTLFPILLPLSMLFFSYVCCSIIDYIHELKEKQFLTNAFEKYASKELVQQIVKQPHTLKLGGEKRHIAVLFSDVRGFTTLSESLTPQELVTFLNEYLTEMTDIVIQREGLLDKYIGDAIMAVYNAPINIDSYELKACLSALDMMNTLETLQKKWKSQNKPHIDIGIGLHSGEAVVGNMGSHQRFDYTAMGDTVNLASRLESLTKHYGVRCLLSQAMFNAIQKDTSSQWHIREIDQVKVKGKTQPVRIFELRTKPIMKKNIFEKALYAYYEGKFEHARELFEQVNDSTSAMFIERCTYLIEHKPEQWFGVWEHKNK